MPQYVDLGSERAIVGVIVEAQFWKIPHEALVPVETFHDPLNRLIYQAAIELDKRGLPVCLGSVNKWLEDTGNWREIQKVFDPTRSVDWHAWSQDADISLAYTEPPFAAIKWALSELQHYYIERKGAEICSDAASGVTGLKFASEALAGLLAQKHGSNGDSLPKVIDAHDLISHPYDDPVVLIEGILHRGCKMVLGGGSKSFKTWMLLELAVAAATGGFWLGKKVTQGNVVYLNFELPEFAIRTRIDAITEALGVNLPKGRLRLWNLRGHACEATVILPKLGKQLRGGDYSFAIIDPLYKLRPGVDDNAAGNMTTIMNAVDAFTVQIGASSIYGEHFAKGSAAMKDPIDRISGSGVQARDPDAIVLSTKHKEDKCFTIEMVLRCFAPVDSFVVRREHPLMVIEPEMDPEELKMPPKPSGAPSKEKDRAEQIKAALRASKGLTVEQLHAITGIAMTTLRRGLKKMDGVFYSEIDNKWALK